MPTEIIFYSIIILLLLVCSAFFSGSEISFQASNNTRLKKAADEGHKVSRLALNMSEKFTQPLAAILIGNNLVNNAASSSATILAMLVINKITGESNDGAASVAATIFTTIIVLAFGEIIPKIICKMHADKVVLWVAIPIKVLNIILFVPIIIVTGLIKLLSLIWGKDKSENEPTVTKEELSTMIDTAEEEGVMDEDKSELLQSTIEFQDTTVEEIMTARINMTDFDIDDRDAAFEIIEQSRFSRIPVYEGDIDNIIGMLYLNHYYRKLAEYDGDKSKIDLSSLLLKPKMIHKTMKLPAALAMMRKEKMHIAIVVDEFGGTLGLVTMEDILEEIVGEIWDESDVIVSMIAQTGENTYDVSGEMNIDDFFYEIDFQDPNFECDYSTVGGWAIEMLDANPHTGDSFNYKNLCIIVTEMDDMRVTKLTVLVSPIDDEDEE